MAILLTVYKKQWGGLICVWTNPIVFSNAMKDAFHASQFSASANARKISNPRLVKAWSAIAAMENLFVGSFKQAVGHFVSKSTQK